MSELGIASWRQALTNNGLDRFRRIPLAIEDFLGVFCFDPVRRTFIPVLEGGRVPDEQWESELRTRVAATRCASETFHAR
jgi:hypothetical protein